MALARCVFCGKDYEDYTGTYLITNDGFMHYYCSLKCRKNHLKLGRDKRKLKWTAAFYDSREKRYAAEKKAADKIAQASAPLDAVHAKKAKKVSK
ncbi:MAG: hypothetical protein AABX53_00235 [Nanoarchaeota archaeon]